MCRFEYDVMPHLIACLIGSTLSSCSSSWIIASLIGSTLSSSSSSSSGGIWTHHRSSCVYEDHLITDKNWHGYLANITILTSARLTFEFYYPADKCCQNILFYSEDQLSIINGRMNCWQKEYLLRPEEVSLTYQWT